MSYWTKPIDQNNGNFDSNPDILPIPGGTEVNAIIQGVEWDEYMGDRFINIKWAVTDGDYQNRMIFQKIRVLDDNPKKAEKANRMILAIDHNAGGQLAQLGREPSDSDLALALSNKMMMLKLDVWSIDGKSGNWVRAVAPIGGGLDIEEDIAF